MNKSRSLFLITYRTESDSEDTLEIVACSESQARLLSKIDKNKIVTVECTVHKKYATY